MMSPLKSVTGFAAAGGAGPEEGATIAGPGGATPELGCVETGVGVEVGVAPAGAGLA